MRLFGATITREVLTSVVTEASAGCLSSHRPHMDGQRSLRWDGKVPEGLQTQWVGRERLQTLGGPRGGVQHRAQVGPDGQQRDRRGDEAQRKPRPPVEGRGIQQSSRLWLQWEQTPAGGAQVPKTSPLPGTSKKLHLSIATPKHFTLAFHSHIHSHFHTFTNTNGGCCYAKCCPLHWGNLGLRFLPKDKLWTRMLRDLKCKLYLSSSPFLFFFDLESTADC